MFAELRQAGPDGSFRLERDCARSATGNAPQWGAPAPWKPIPQKGYVVLPVLGMDGRPPDRA
jgi:hypothetical protein